MDAALLLSCRRDSASRARQEPRSLPGGAIGAAGAVLASLALMAHAIWDVIHYRRNAVVPRSLAEACMFFDVPLGVAIIVLALAGLS